MRGLILFFCTIALEASLLEEAFKDASHEGYVRFGEQIERLRDKTTHESALGGYLHLQTAPMSGISGGVGFFATGGIHKDESGRIPFFSSENEGYAILGHAYLRAELEKTEITLGRQAIDTPFLNTDDIGMIPNAYEALRIENQTFENTKITLAHVQKMSGVGAALPEKFTDIHGDNGVQMIGALYEGIEQTTLQGWHYHLGDEADVSYGQADFEREFRGAVITLGAQVARQDFKNSGVAGIYGGFLELKLEEKGLAFYVAHNQADSDADVGADNLFGGGPFFTNSFHFTLPDAGADAKASCAVVEYDAKAIGAPELNLMLLYFHADSKDNLTLIEQDLLVSFAFSDALSADLIVSDGVDHHERSSDFTNARLFVNYKF